jgi:hypothetical protein
MSEPTGGEEWQRDLYIELNQKTRHDLILAQFALIDSIRDVTHRLAGALGRSPDDFLDMLLDEATAAIKVDNHRVLSLVKIARLALEAIDSDLCKKPVNWREVVEQIFHQARDAQ